MSAEPAQPRPYLKMLSLAALIGLVSAIATFTFMALVHLGQAVLWKEAAAALDLSLPIFTLVVCTLGGLLGACW